MIAMDDPRVHKVCERMHLDHINRAEAIEEIIGLGYDGFTADEIVSDEISLAREG